MAEYKQLKIFNEYDKMPLFRDIPAEEAQSMMTYLHSYKKIYPKDSFIYLMNDDVNALGVVLSGTVTVIHENRWGDQSCLGILMRGSLIGESYIGGIEHKSTVSFCAKEKSTVLFIPASQLFQSNKDCCPYYNYFMRNLIDIIAERNEKFILRLQVLSEKGLKKKIMTYLFFQAARAGSDSITLSFSRADFARYLCANRTSVLRTLNELKQEGVIKVHHNEFTLIKKDFMK